MSNRTSELLAVALAAHRVCCKADKDIPAVQAFVHVATPLAESHWRRVVEGAMRDLELRMRDLTEDLGLERVDALTIGRRDDLEKALLVLLASLYAALLSRAAAPPTPPVQDVLAAAGRGLLEVGAQAVGLPLDFTMPTAGTLPSEALDDLLLVLRGRLTTRRTQVTTALRAFLTRKDLRDGTGLAAWRAEIRALLGGSTGDWLPQTVDAWAYRTYNIGGFQAMKDAGVQVIRLVNNPPHGPDGRTTPFCRLIHNRIVPMERVEAQVRRYHDAVQADDAGAAARAWPLRFFTGSEPLGELEALAVRAGLPPYHFWCRTQARPD